MNGAEDSSSPCARRRAGRAWGPNNISAALVAGVLLAGACGVGCGPKGDPAPIPRPDEFVDIVPEDPLRLRLRKLPARATGYSTVAATAIPDVLASMPSSWIDKGGLAAESERAFGIDPFVNLAAVLTEELGIDLSRPMVGAVAVIDEARARRTIAALIEHMGKGLPFGEPELRSIFGTTAQVGWSRLIVPMADPSKIRAVAERLFRDGLRLERLRACAGIEACAPFSEAFPSLRFVMESFESVVFLFLDDGDLVVDVQMRVFIRPRPERLIDVLRSVREKHLGGPEAGRCNELDPDAAFSACIDADRLAELGTVMGWSSLFDALADAAPDMKVAMLHKGIELADLSMQLAAASGRPLEDLTFTVVSEDRTLNVNLLQGDGLAAGN